ncbi:MAG: uroporphyrinogen decarboxylase family protein [Anaerolineae bacterium]
MSSPCASRERMLAALDRQQPDHLPCAFMIFGALKARCQSYAEFVERQVEMGLDAFVELPPRPPVVVNDHYNLHGLPVVYDPRVEIREWLEERPSEAVPVMVKEYHTPGGVLRTEVRQTEDWRWGNHVPLFDDYLVPRTSKCLITCPDDLNALPYILAPLGDAELQAFRAESAPAIAQARQHGLLVAGGWGAAADAVAWLTGFENMIVFTAEQPDFMRDLLGLVADWNRRRLEVLLDVGIDLYLKRIFYESTDFWSPRLYREFLQPILKEDVDLAHQAGARVGGMMTTGTLPLVDALVETGLDAVIGIDPLVTDLTAIKEKAAGRLALWGGLNGYITVEEGSEEEVRSAVRQAFEVLAPGGGAVLSPVENVRATSERTWHNTLALVDEWQRCARQT